MTTACDEQLHRPANLVKRNFVVKRPNGLWVSDLTYVATWRGVAYVASSSTQPLVLPLLAAERAFTLGSPWRTKGCAGSAGLRMIVHFGTKRSAQVPDVPTAKESGFDVVMTPERGIAVPRGVPDNITQKISDAIKRILDKPEFQKRAKELSLSLAYLSGPDWESQMRASLKTFQKTWAETPWGER